MFDRFLNVTLVLVLAYGIYLLRTQEHRHEGGGPGGPPTTYAESDTVPPLPGIDYASADQTLVLFLASGCKFCTDSMPFYRSLVDARERSGRALQLVTIGFETPVTLQSYIESHQLRIDQIAQVKPAEWQKLSGTPTLLLVGKGGRVRKSWLGGLSAEKEREVRSVLGFERS